MRYCFHLLLAAFFLVLISPLPTPAEEKLPSPADLIRLIPTLNLKDGKFTSGEISGWFSPWENGSPIQFTVKFQAPDKFLLRVEDSKDGALFSQITQDQTLIYDPVVGQALLCPGGKAKGQFIMRQKKDMLEFAMGLSFDKNDAKDKVSHQIELDLPGLLQAPTLISQSVARQKDGQFLLTGISQKGNRLDAWIQPGKKMPITRIDMINLEKAPGRKVMCLTRIVVNEEIPASEFRSPTQEEWKKVIPVRLVDSESYLSMMEAVMLFSRAGYARVGISNPEARELLKYPGLVGINWDAAAANDKKFAPLLKELLESKKKEPVILQTGN